MSYPTFDLPRVPDDPARLHDPVTECPVNLPRGWRFVVDTNEGAAQHLAYEIDPSVQIHLETGDYTLMGPDGRCYEDEIVVERKSHADFLGCICGPNRERWERCMERMSALPQAHLVVESSLFKLAGGEGDFEHTRVNPRSVMGSLAAWAVRYRFSVWPVRSRMGGRLWTQWLLTKWAQDRNKQASGGEPEACLSPGNHQAVGSDGEEHRGSRVG